MGYYRFYIQQSTYDGDTYAKGEVFDSYETWGIVCKEIPFKLFPEIKQPASRDWKGSDGLDVYVPPAQRFKEYEIDVEFGYAGTDEDLHTNIKSFLGFLFGRNGAPQRNQSGVLINTQSDGARLFVYEEYTRTGRKDVVATKSDVQDYYLENGADEALAIFHVTFTIYDPVTDVAPTYDSEQRITNLAIV